MDHMMELMDHYALDALYEGVSARLEAIGMAAIVPHLVRTALLRQSLSLFFSVAIGGVILYLVTATLSYFLLFDKAVQSHPKYLPNQIQKEISLAVPSIFGMSALTLPIFLLDVRGYAKFYRNVDDYGIPYMIFTVFFFLLFTDGLIYCIHRALHWPWLYKNIHKPHHRWVVCTPYASHAFAPADGVAQSLPYHLYGFLFPMHSVLWVVMFVVVNCWTVSIHDGNHFSDSTFINTEAHHAVHHTDFNYNYGQFTTIFDRLGGSYRLPVHLRPKGQKFADEGVDPSAAVSTAAETSAKSSAKGSSKTSAKGSSKGSSKGSKKSRASKKNE
eukprot:a1089_290.p1 GENE.a1089_290~~a1089_290.p1  ORF type:complete len:340 (-),score=101.30 a1089_290:19-1005(-)